ncbi:hypothetical protein NC653_005439 [Populus alba x Populus x berolinensis]|uniref:Uncharacterized protein n=1 Tax=Populus alba x Populus x berolinensis TaxID=444605 RepID=A0AAD6RBV9_9ROSI|nr:hypothetical protein NC653_005439 [Populus alba x Populus x berolinensis]
MESIDCVFVEMGWEECSNALHVPWLLWAITWPFKLLHSFPLQAVYKHYHKESREVPSVHGEEPRISCSEPLLAPPSSLKVHEHVARVE